MEQSHSSESVILDRIQKLFQLADPSRGATEHEIKAALEKAEQLMTRYNIDRARILIAGESAPQAMAFEKNSIPTTQRTSTKSLLLFSLLQAATSIKVILDKQAMPPAAHFFGSSTDLAYAQFLYVYLSDVFESLWSQHRRQHADSHQNSYLQGLHDGILDSIKKGKVEAETELKSTEKNRYEIVLRDEKEGLQKFIHQQFGPTERTRSRNSVRDSRSYYSGQNDGQNVRLQRPLSDR